jgi:hypothetical protein
MIILGVTAERPPMSDDPSDIIMAAIGSAFSSYSKERDPDWRSPKLDKVAPSAYFIVTVTFA